MQIATRYLMKNILSVALFVVVTLTVLIWLTQALRFLELIANSDAPVSLFLKLVILSLPRFLEILIPIALVTAVIFVYHRMIVDNELVILRVCGVSHIPIAKPAIALASGITALLLLMSLWLTPYSHASMNTLREVIRAEYSTLLLREGGFNVFGQGLTIYLRSRSPSGELRGVMIHDNRDKDSPPVTITAKKGALVMVEGTPKVVIQEGLRQQFDPVSGAINKLYFDRHTLEITGFSGPVRDRWVEPSERTFLQLINPDLENPRDVQALKRFRVEVHKRLTAPLNALSFTLVALVCLLLGSYNRRGHTRKVLLAIGLVAGLQILTLFVHYLARGQIGLVPLFYLFSILPIAVSLWLLSERGTNRLSLLFAPKGGPA